MLTWYAYIVGTSCEFLTLDFKKGQIAFGAAATAQPVKLL